MWLLLASYFNVLSDVIKKFHLRVLWKLETLKISKYFFSFCFIGHTQMEGKIIDTHGQMVHLWCRLTVCFSCFMRKRLPHAIVPHFFHISSFYLFKRYWQEIGIKSDIFLHQTEFADFSGVLFELEPIMWVDFNFKVLGSIIQTILMWQIILWNSALGLLFYESRTKGLLP